MEGICASSSWGSTDRVKDPKLRMQSRPQPPPPTQSRRGAAYEDFGSDFTKKDVQGPSKPGAKVKARARPTSIDSGSSDELDSLPPTRAGSRAGSEIEIVEDKKTGGFEEKKPLYSTIPRGLRFKKMPPTTTSQGNDDKLVDLTSSQPTVLNEHGNSQPSGSSRPIPLPGISRPNSPRGRSPAPRTPAIPRQRGQTTAPTTRATTPPTQNRPKPRPLNKGTSTPQLVPKAFPGTDLTPRYPSRRQTIAATPTRPSPPRTCNNTNSAKRKAAEFPHLSPRTPAKFPLALDSPKKGKRSVSETVAAFKPPQPRAADKKGSAEAKIRKKLSDGSAKARNKTIISSEEEEKEDDTPQAPPAPKAQPFPMSTQAFDGIGLLPPAAGPSSLKRSSSGSYDESESKRMKEDVFDLVDAEDEHVEPNVDPSTLCPYCDAPLPSEPTPQLRKLLATAEKRSRREPRPGNRLGRTAPFIVYISICQRHRFESQMLPEAERKGWPKTIDWIELGKRVRKMRNVLRAIIEDTGADGEEDRPKARCVFWREAVAEVKQKGTRAVAGVKGQFASFEKMQPGYYGEMGSVVIYQTLYDLFPPTSIDPDCVSPLTASEFLQRILVPEIGARLIIQDMYMDETEMDDAVKILRESANYGVAMFPADDGEEGEGRDDGELGAADMILMKRAMKRRKELDEDEKEEEEEFQREIREKEKREKEREKKIESSPPRPPPRRKPRHIGKITSTASIINDVEMVPSVPLEGDTDIDDAPRSAHDPPRPRPLPSRGRPGTLEQLAGNPESKKASDTRPKPRRLPSANIPRSTDTDVEDAPLHSSQSRPKPRRLVSQSSIDVRPPDANATPRKAKHSIPAQDSSDVDIELCSSSEDAADNDDDDDWDVGRMERGKKKRKAKAKAKGTSKALNTTSINAARIDNDFPLPSSTRTPRKSVSREKRFLDSDEEETPRPGRVKSSAQALPYEPPNDLVPPLQRARERKVRSTASGDNQENHAWLLSDNTHSSMESIQS